MRLLIAGYGNPLRRDDGFGWLAAERLRETLADPDVEVLVLHQLTPELMEPVSRAERVIFLDASAGGNPGELRITPVEPGAATLASFTHAASPGALLAGAATLYGHAPQAVLVTTAGVDFEIGEGLSAPVAKAVELAVEWVAGQASR